MRFLLQTVGGRIVHDFTFALERAREYYTWYNVGKEPRFREPFIIRRMDASRLDEVRRPDLYVPVGEVGFVSEYLRRFYPDAEMALRPLNIPVALRPFAGRTVVDVEKAGDLSVFSPGSTVYCKSNERIKHPDNGAVRLSPTMPWERLAGYQVSSHIGVVSEWRVMVFHGRVLYTANYAGDPLVFPDGERISEMVAAWDGAPVAWTLDVAVTEGGETVVVECHRFFSCGLYGFGGHELPKMLSQAWHEMRRRGGPSI